MYVRRRHEPIISISSVPGHRGSAYQPVGRSPERWQCTVKQEASIAVNALPYDKRRSARWLLDEGFSGIYRMHARYTLKRADIALVATAGGREKGLVLIDRLTPKIGYVYYIAVARDFRHMGLGGRLLDSALRLMREEGIEEVYAVREEDNIGAQALFNSRKFEEVNLHDFTRRFGYLRSLRLRRQMTMVRGETLMRKELGR